MSDSSPQMTSPKRAMREPTAGRNLVAWNIRRLRVERAISQESLASDAGVDRTYVSRLERGLENPTVIGLEKIADALGTHIAGLFAEPAPGESPPQPLKAGRPFKR